MERLQTPRVLLSGVSNGVGKFLLAVGIVHELRRLGYGVSCGVLGPNILQAVVLRRLTGRYVRCFDHTFLSRSQNVYNLFHASVGADVVFLLGQNGLFDSSLPSSLKGSDAEFATLSGTPVILTVDGSHLGTSIAAIIKGFDALSKPYGLGGAIVTRVSEREIGGHTKEDLFSEALRREGLAPLLGLLGPTSFEHESPPSVVDESKNRTVLSRQFFLEIAQLVREHVDLETLMEVASRAPVVELPDLTYEPSPRRARIGVAEDSCFHICFQDNVELLKYYGAEIIPFSPLADEELPSNISGVYLPSGVIREYGYELSRNESFRSSLKRFIDGGGVVYSEGSGTAYLCSSFEIEEGNFVEGVGVLPGVAYHQSGILTSNEGVTVEDSILGEPGIILKSLSLNSWRYAEESPVPQ
ncbi:MAG: hypothetical protein KDD55_02875, partial [Bdellovibrionales bacterium]|nr:hypothetical protein [Bdellovibrionales bacterium]